MSGFIVGPPVLPQQQEIEKKDLKKTNGKGQRKQQSARATSSQLLWAKILGKSSAGNAEDEDDGDEVEEEEKEKQTEPKGPLKFDEPLKNAPSNSKLQRQQQSTVVKRSPVAGRGLLDKSSLPSRNNFKGFGIRSTDPSNGKSKEQKGVSVTPPGSESEVTILDEDQAPKKDILSKAASKYAQFKCTMCNYSGYTLQLLEAHRKLRNHYPLGMTREVGHKRPLMPEPSSYVQPFALTPSYGAGTQQPQISWREIPKVKPLLPLPAEQQQQYGQQYSMQSQFGPIVEPGFQPQPVPILSAAFVNETLSKFGLPPGCIPYEGLTSDQFLGKLEELVRQTEANRLKQRIESIVQPVETAEQPPAKKPMNDTERLLSIALEAKDYKTAKELTELLEKEREIESRKASLAKAIAAEQKHDAASSVDESANDQPQGSIEKKSDDFERYWEMKRSTATGTASSESTSWTEEPLTQQQIGESWKPTPVVCTEQLPTQPSTAEIAFVPPNPLTHFSYEKQAIPSGVDFPSVELTYMADDPSFFWVNLPFSEDKLVNISEQVAKLWKENTLVPVERPVKSGLGCLAFLDIKGTWYHRVEVVQEMANGEIRCRLIDEGRLASVPNSNHLRYVPSNSESLSQTPALAIPCMVVDFRPNQRWATHGQDCFDIFKTALCGARKVSFLGRSEDGMYRLAAFSDRGQPLSSFLINKGLGTEPAPSRSSDPDTSLQTGWRPAAHQPKDQSSFFFR